MKLRKKHREEDFNFWQPASDLFAALMLIMMLVILLLALYLVSQGNWFKDNEYGDSSGGGSPVSTADIVQPTEGRDDDDGGGGGGQETPIPADPSASPTAEPSPTPTPTPQPPGPNGAGGGEGGGNGQGEGPGDEPDAGMKSAVYVMLVDAETDRTIKVPGVQFELYAAGGSLQILNTYYPEKITYRLYETTEAGTFYFPEKLYEGEYYLHELTEAEGYDAAENTDFILNEVYDWPEPLVVRVPVYPSRNVIRVQMNDADTGLPVSGGSFDVVAAEDVITADGTLRYSRGQVVDRIECDEEGKGVSAELYLGSYYLRQHDIPRYYAGMTGTIRAIVDKKTDVEPVVKTIAAHRTRLTLRLTDELYPERGLQGIPFTVTASDGSMAEEEFTTDSRGCFTLDELEKGVTYSFRQTGSEGDYRYNDSPATASVTSDGRIGGEIESELTLTNRVIRVSIGVTDVLGVSQVPNVNLALYDGSDKLVRSWTTNGSPANFTNLEPGTYYLIKDGDEQSRYQIEIADSAEPQSINIRSSFATQYILFGIAGAVGLAAAITVAVTLGRRKKRRKNAGRDRES